MIAVERGNLTREAGEGGDGASIRVEQGDALGLDTTQAGEIASDDDTLKFSIFGYEGAHCLDVRVGIGERGEGAIGEAGEEGLAAVGVEGQLVLALELIEGEAVEVAGECDAT